MYVYKDKKYQFDIHTSSLVYFFWEKNKVITTLRNLTTSRAPVVKVSFHPKNHSVICVVGVGFFRMARLTEGVFKTFGFSKVDSFPAEALYLSFMNH